MRNRHAFSTLALLAGLVTASANASQHLPPIEAGGIYPIGETILCDTEEQIRIILDAYVADPTAGDMMLVQYGQQINDDGESACAYMRGASRYIVTAITDPVYAIEFQGEVHRVRAVSVQYIWRDQTPREGWLVLPVEFLGRVDA